MAEQLLDRPQIGSALEQVGREGVPEAVRVRHQAAKGRRVEAAAADGEEEGVDGTAGELRPRLADIPGDPVGGLLSERHHPLLRALPLAHVDVLLLEVDVPQIEANGLATTQPGRVDELE